MTMTKRFLMGATVAAAMTIGGAAHAQSYPTRPITVIIPFAGGSASDVVSRIMFNKMSQSLGQPIVVENKPGAGGNSGTQLAAKAAPDGYTLVGAGSGPIAANLELYKSLGYDPLKELTIISPFASFTIVVTASNKLGIKTVKELIERAKKEPGALNYGSVGIGSSQHLAGEYFAQVTGVKMTHVPYRNIGQFGPDLISGTSPARLPVVSERRRPDQRQRRDRPRRRRRCAARRIARHADHDAGRVAAIQSRRLVRARRSCRRTGTDHAAAQQGAERRAQRSGGEGGLREGRRRADRLRA